MYAWCEAISNQWIETELLLNIEMLVTEMV